MDELAELIKSIEQEKLERASRMSSSEKLSAGIECFDLACDFMRIGIRHQHPQANADQLEQLMRERLALGRRSAIHEISFDELFSTSNP